MAHEVPPISWMVRNALSDLASVFGWHGVDGLIFVVKYVIDPVYTLFLNRCPDPKQFSSW